MRARMGDSSADLWQSDYPETSGGEKVAESGPEQLAECVRECQPPSVSPARRIGHDSINEQIGPRFATEWGRVRCVCGNSTMLRLMNARTAPKRGPENGGLELTDGVTGRQGAV